MEQGPFAGKVAIVTGSARRIGAARHVTGVMSVVEGGLHLSLPR